MGKTYSEDLTQADADRGRRASDIINGLIVAHPWDDIKNTFVAINLEDGSSDGVLYESKADAVKHQNFEQQCAYVSFRNLMAGSSPKDMAIYLKFNADAYQAGMRLVDPDNQKAPVQDLLIPSAGFDQMKLKLNVQEAMQRFRAGQN